MAVGGQALFGHPERRRGGPDLRGDADGPPARDSVSPVPGDDYPGHGLRPAGIRPDPGPSDRTGPGRRVEMPGGPDALDAARRADPAPSPARPSHGPGPVEIPRGPAFASRGVALRPPFLI